MSEPERNLLVVVNNRTDEVTRFCNFEYVHREGILHRAVLVVPFKEPSLDTMLVTQRGDNAGGGGKWQVGVVRHVFMGENYELAAERAVLEQLYCKREALPSHHHPVPLGKFKHDSFRQNPLGYSKNNEMIAAFSLVYWGEEWNMNSKLVNAVQWMPEREVFAQVPRQGGEREWTQTAHKFVSVYRLDRAMQAAQGRRAFIPYGQP